MFSKDFTPDPKRGEQISLKDFKKEQITELLLQKGLLLGNYKEQLEETLKEQLAHANNTIKTETKAQPKVDTKTQDRANSKPHSTGDIKVEKKTGINTENENQAKVEGITQ